MRALVGAIITAGALIGLGLTNLGIGVRYQYLSNITVEGNAAYDMKFHLMDNPFRFGVAFLALIALVGLAVAFIGLMYHHERRHREAQLGVRGDDLAP